MKTTLKRTLAMIMSLSMLSSIAVINASAEEVSSDNVETATTDSEEATTADSEEVNISADKCLGYQITSDEYKESLKKYPKRIDYIEDTFSYFDTLEIDDGYQLEDIMNRFGNFDKSNHFKATGTWGDNIEWVYDHGTLKLTGTGCIDPISGTATPWDCETGMERFPWSTFLSIVSDIVVSDGITTIPEECFTVVWNGVKSITFGKDVTTIAPSAIDFQHGEKTVDRVDLYFPEGAMIMGQPFEGYKGKLVIHSYTNGTVDYYFQEFGCDVPNYEFVSLGTAKENYYDYKCMIESESVDYHYNLKSVLDINGKTLTVSKDKNVGGFDSAVSSNILNPTVVNGELYYDDDYCKYVEKLYLSDDIKSVLRLKELYNLKEIYVPDSVTRLPIKRYLPTDISQLTIIANKGTYAEEYAKEYGINFVDAKEYSKDKTLNNVDLNSTEPVTEAPTSSEIAEETKAESLKLGDINLDGDVTIADAILLNKYLVGSVTLSEASQKNADCDKDGKLTSSDTLVILDYVVGSIDEIK